MAICHRVALVVAVWVSSIVESTNDTSCRVVSRCQPRSVVGSDAVHIFSLCEASFPTARQLSSHSWAKHRQRGSIRQNVGNISACPVCKNEFFSRARLIKHLLERRVRSKTRGYSCRLVFMDQFANRVPSNELQLLDSKALHWPKRLDGWVTRTSLRTDRASVVSLAS